MAKIIREETEKLYCESFQPEDYVNTYYKSLDHEVEFFLTNLHNYFNSKVAESVDVSCWSTTRDVLEIGSGPVPISMLSASRWSEWIVCSDFLERNRLKMSQWLTKQHHEEDQVWLPFSTFVHQLERPSSSLDESGQMLLDRVRRSVRAVVPCNVFMKDPLLGRSPPPDQYDVIITTLCLEFAAPTEPDYLAAVVNVSRLLRPSGHLIVQGALGNSHYWHNGQKFPSLSLDRNMVEGSLKAAGCRILEWKELERCCPVEDKPADHSAVFYCLALRI